MGFAIVVHGGAGYHSEDETSVKAAMKRACLKAADTLKSGGTALDGVESAIRVLEDDEYLNAGYGSNLTLDENVECDAALMTDNGAFGAVGAIRGIKNPISAARVVLEKARPTVVNALGRVPPLMLAGEGAVRYVLDSAAATGSAIPEPLGCPQQVDLVTMISPRARRELAYWQSRLASTQYQPNVKDERPPMSDTVGAIVCTGQEMAAGVSSGGLLLKNSGRIGEAAVYGAGCWAKLGLDTSDQPRGVACSISGTGEQIIRGGLARSIGEACNPDTCEDPIEALSTVFENLIASERDRNLTETHELQAGTVTLYLDDMEPGVSAARLLVAFTTPSMAVGTYASEEQRPKVKILRQSLPPSGSKGGLYISSTLLETFVANKQHDT